MSIVEQRAAVAPARPARPAALGLLARAAGPALLVAAGYVDPGNWGTDLAAGSREGVRLLWVLVACNAVAVLVQYLAAKLGAASGDDLATLVGRRLTRRSAHSYWLVTEGAMAATELAELAGVVVALRLLLPLSRPEAVVLAVAVIWALTLLTTPRRARLELAVAALLAVVAGVYVLELVLARPGAAVLHGLRPTTPRPGALVLVVALAGATIMPHNLFLHSGLLRSEGSVVERRRHLWRATALTGLTLAAAVAVNGAIVVMTAVLAQRHGPIATLTDAHRTLAPLLGPAAATTFALALLAAGLASALTVGAASQMVTDGLLGTRGSLGVRRLVVALPAAALLLAGVGELDAMVWSQFALAVVLPFVFGPLLLLTSDRSVMGDFVNRPRTVAAGLVVLTLVVAGVGATIAYA